MNSSRSLFLCRQRNLALAKDNNRRDRNPLWANSGHCTTYSGKLRRSGDRLHLNSDAVDRFSGSVENPSEWLRRQVHDQTSLAIPILDRLHDISVRRQFSAIWSNIVHGPLHSGRTRTPMAIGDVESALRRLAPRLLQGREAARSRIGLCGASEPPPRHPMLDPK